MSDSNEENENRYVKNERLMIPIMEREKWNREHSSDSKSVAKLARKAFWKKQMKIYNDSDSHGLPKKQK